MSGLLREEHELLGAVFAEKGAARVATYGSVSQELEGLRTGVGLVDLSGLETTLLAGGPAEHFVHTVFSGHHLGIGSCNYQAALLGDGSLASVALVARTGGTEHIVLDMSSRNELLGTWLGFISRIEQGDYAPYADLEMEDVSENLFPLLLWGPMASAVLLDYLGNQELPTTGMATSLALDAISCMAIVPPLGTDPAYLLYVPPQRARILWRSFLSFHVVTPVGGKALRKRLSEELPWFSRLGGGADKLWIGEDELRMFGVTRRERDYIGARGLGSREA